MLLTALPPLLRHEPALLELLGRASATLSVPEGARALTLAGIADASSRHPFLIITPTGADADRLAGDLATFLGPDEVDTFPAWETLPFERVSPSVETMGRRLRTMWHLSDPERAPRVVVAPVRAVIQRLGPHVAEVDPIIIGPGDRVDPTELVERLVHLGYRREYQVENRGEVAVRGSIVDVFPSTADGPVRIDLWGDEVDRLTEFTVADQRATVERAEVEIFGCRELLATEEVAERARSLTKTEPWGNFNSYRISDRKQGRGVIAYDPNINIRLGRDACRKRVYCSLVGNEKFAFDRRTILPICKTPDNIYKVIPIGFSYHFISRSSSALSPSGRLRKMSSPFSWL